MRDGNQECQAQYRIWHAFDGKVFVGLGIKYQVDESTDS